MIHAGIYTSKYSGRGLFDHIRFDHKKSTFRDKEFAGFKIQTQIPSVIFTELIEFFREDRNQFFDISTDIIIFIGYFQPTAKINKLQVREFARNIKKNICGQREYTGIKYV